MERLFGQLWMHCALMRNIDNQGIGDYQQCRLSWIADSNRFFFSTGAKHGFVTQHSYPQRSLKQRVADGGTLASFDLDRASIRQVIFAHSHTVLCESACL